jgi:S-formylglutathione hydrolase FrmB
LRPCRPRLRWLAIALLGCLCVNAHGAGISFSVRIDPSLMESPYTGRLYVVIAPDSGIEPRLGVGNWFNPPQILAVDVDHLAPGEPVTIDGGQVSFPAAPEAIAPGTYVAQAFGRLNPDSPDPGRGAGDPISAPATVEVVMDAAPDANPIELTIDRLVEPEPFEETDRVRLFQMVSPSLSAFHGREVVMRAGVRLPEGWSDDPGAAAQTAYPTVYWITGFGGDHTSVEGLDRMLSRIPGAEGCLIVVPDASCYWGHTAFVDSATNGPRGTALVHELIPAVEARFRGAGDASRRAVAGGSSGGWASLWLQVTHPDTFGSCWAHCPDPVDFRDFQMIDLYAPGANMYRDEHGNPRPIARRAGRVILEYEQFVRMETAMGPGGQIASFEATFSPCGPDGLPIPLFDRATGAVDPDVARAWEPYDIRLVLERNWETLGPKLAGKLHIFAGEIDTFYLEGAVKLLDRSLKALGSDAEVVIVEGMGHATSPEGVRKMFRSLTSEADALTPGEPASAPVDSQ